MDRFVQVLKRIARVVTVLLGVSGWFSVGAAQAAVSPSPTALTQQIFALSVFAEPLVPMGATSAQDDKALLHAISLYERAHRTTNFTPFSAYLHRDPRSLWAVALWTNEGLIDQAHGYYDFALSDFQKAWRRGRPVQGLPQKALVGYAVANLARLEARFAEEGPLTRLLRSVRGRTLTGPSAALLGSVRQSLWEMQHVPQTAFRCGPMALKAVLTDLYPQRPENTKLCVAPVTRKGLSLVAMQNLARTVGLTYVMARPTRAARFPIPSVVHWRVNHYATLVSFQNGRYAVRDPAFNHRQWFTRRALLHETTAVLIPPAALSQGFVRIGAHQGAQIWGRGGTAGNDLNGTTPYDQKIHPPGQPQKSCKSQTHSCPCPGMAHYSVSAMLVSLSIRDTPWAYTPPWGPKIPITFTYNAYDITQPANFTFGNVGPQWTTNWTSYIEDNPQYPDSYQIFRVFPGGGGEVETATKIVSPGDITYAPEPLTGAQLFKIGLASYKRVLPNGTVQLYNTSNNASAYPRKILLTSITGPRGHTVTLHYDSEFRLTAITDALGQVTTFRYADSQYPLQVTSVTDPFGRTATLTYDSEGRLTSTTDPLGMTSRYTYSGTSTTITALTTPYGTTQFHSAIVGNTRLLTITDPLGHTEKVEYIQGVSSIPFYDAHPPAGMSLFNEFMTYRDTYVWNPDVYAQSPDDFTEATIDHWLHSQVGLTSRVLESIKHPLQHWLWYSYPNQYWSGGVGTLDKPSAIGVQLGDGKTDLTTLNRNSIGHVTERVGPDGHTTFITYAANGIDPITVSQQTPQGAVVVARATYNTQHEPLTATNAAGETTTTAYNAAGQLTSRTDPLGHTTQYVYDSAGYLTSIVNPNGQTEARFTYDAEGRVASYTNAAGTTVDYTYDALNRITGITYPDGTSRTYTYQNLNV
ncbi:MAG: cysteine peptidase family C39 domain-containing protein, partial [Acidiferrobacter sp.]